MVDPAVGDGAVKCPARHDVVVGGYAELGRVRIDGENGTGPGISEEVRKKVIVLDVVVDFFILPDL